MVREKQPGLGNDLGRVGTEELQGKPCVVKAGSAILPTHQIPSLSYPRICNSQEDANRHVSLPAQLCDSEVSSPTLQLPFSSSHLLLLLPPSLLSGNQSHLIRIQVYKPPSSPPLLQKTASMKTAACTFWWQLVVLPSSALLMSSPKANSISLQTAIFNNTFLSLLPWPPPSAPHLLSPSIHLLVLLKAMPQKSCLHGLSQPFTSPFTQPPLGSISSLFFVLLQLGGTSRAHSSLFLSVPFLWLLSHFLSLFPVFQLQSCYLYHGASTWGLLRTGLSFQPYLYTISIVS